MKFIEKSQEPQEITDWKNKRNANWQPSFNNLQNPEKKTLKTQLMADQGYICCYCERRLTDIDSHIEHLQPQSNPVVDNLDFANLLCSCNPLENSRRKPSHCGNSKGDWFNSALLVSPLQPDCEKRFAFTCDGHIHTAAAINDGAVDAAAAETIERLGLDIPRLRQLRKKVIEAFIEELPSADFNDFVDFYLRRDNDGHLEPFWTTIRSLFGTDPTIEFSPQLRE